MNINHDLLRINIQSSSAEELNIDELIASAKIHNDTMIIVSNKQVSMIFNSDYELVECYGNAVTEEIIGEPCQ